MAEWRLVRIGADYATLSKKYNLDPVVMRIIRNRGVESEEELEEYLHGQIETADRTDGFLDMEKGCAFIRESKRQGKRVRIIGDYDIDGICATAILVKGLAAFGIVADYAIPHRIEDGYGLSKDLIERAKADGVEAIITCDNGISAHEAVALANGYGMQVLITDHHEIMRQSDDETKEYLPEAVAVINPKREGNTCGFKEICGAYTAYKLISHLLDLASLKPEYEELRKELLELAAFATIGDIMPLQKENRTLVRFGLKAMQQSNNIGLRRLITNNDLAGRKINAYHIGFVLGPCMNATGRLDTAERALHLLLTDDDAEADRIALELKKMNEVRKELTAEGEEEAIRLIQETGMQEDDVICLYLPASHESIAGIIAGRIKEKFYKPTFVFTNAVEGIKGSGRSIPAYDMYAHLWEVRELFTKFGGHKMAAGISMAKENFAFFRKVMNANANLSVEDLTEVISIDVDMPMSYVTFDLLEDLEVLEPFGNGNAKPVFAQRNLVFESEKLFGAKQQFASYKVRDEQGKRFELKYFGDVSALHHYVDEKCGEGTVRTLYSGGTFTLSVIYQPEINEYRGIKSIQFRLVNYK